MTVKKIIIDSFESTWGLPEGERVAFWCAWDCDSAERLYQTESVYRDETMRLVGEHFPDAVLVAEIASIEKGGRL